MALEASGVAIAGACGVGGRCLDERTRVKALVRVEISAAVLDGQYLHALVVGQHAFPVLYLLVVVLHHVGVDGDVVGGGAGVGAGGAVVLVFLVQISAIEQAFLIVALTEDVVTQIDEVRNHHVLNVVLRVVERRAELRSRHVVVHGLQRIAVVTFLQPHGAGVAEDDVRGIADEHVAQRTYVLWLVAGGHALVGGHAHALGAR